MRKKYAVLLLILLSVLFVDIGQLLLKKGLNDVGSFDLSLGLVSSFVAVFNNWFVVLGVVLFVASSFFWLLALSKAQLSYAFPILSVGYIFVTFLSWLFLGEAISVLRAVGLGVIVGGVFLLSKT